MDVRFLLTYFILCAQSLSPLLIKAENTKLIQGIKFDPKCPTISHLFFTDDSLVFSKASIAICYHLKELFDPYSKASGEVINYEKSYVCFSPNTLENIREAINGILNLEVVSHYEKYLGFLSMLGQSKKSSFNTLKARILHKITDWKSKLFSSGGKEVLIKDVV